MSRLGGSVSNFYADVISRDLRFDSPQRFTDPALLEPMTRELIEQLLRSARKMTIEVMIYETYRSSQRQQELFNRGATQLRTAGVHHYGLACDIVRVVGGEPSWKGDFSFLGELAQSCGLIWGGDWGAPQKKHRFIDRVHLQRCSVSRQGELFEGAWYPDETYNPYNDTADLLVASTRDRSMPAQAVDGKRV